MKEQYILNGLDCAHCAGKIEDKINKIDGVSASINFTSKTLSLEYDNKQQLSESLKTVTDIEPDVKVTKKNENNEEEQEFSPITIFLILVGIVLFSLHYIPVLPFVFSQILVVSGYLLISHKIILNLLKKVKSFDIFDENFLMVVASAGAMIIGESLEGIAVMLFFQIGEYAQDRAVNNSRKSISALLAIKPDTARIVKDGFEASYPPEQVHIGDTVKVLVGEKIPLDAVIIEGETTLDTSALTGESIPQNAFVGDEVLSGSINLSSVILLKVTKEFSNSTVSKILDMVENSYSKKSKSENFITKFARIYTPCVVLFALILGVTGSLITGNVEDWTYRALSFLVVSCPCALVLSIPLCYFCSIGVGSKLGIMIKGGNYVETLSKIETVVFDKTGTLTTGSFNVDKIICKNGFNKEEIVEYAAAVESQSNHPIAKSIADLNNDIDFNSISNVEEIAAHGIKAEYKGKTVLVGSERLLKKYNVSTCKIEESGVFVAIDGIFAGMITISDEIKDTSAESIELLKKFGVTKTVMLTGDNYLAASKTAEKIGIDEFKSNLLPDDKAKEVEKIVKTSKVAFVGDGINDAPVIALSDVGFAMGDKGSDSAIEAADIVIMNDNPLCVAKAIDLSKKTKIKAMQNIIFCLAIKVIIMILSAIGVPNIMWAAVFADVGVALIAVLNSCRLLKYKS